MTNKRLQALVWVLIYGGMLALVGGWFVQSASLALGAVLMAAGTALAAGGIALIVVRSRRGP